MWNHVVKYLPTCLKHALSQCVVVVVCVRYDNRHNMSNQSFWLGWSPQRRNRAANPPIFYSVTGSVTTHFRFIVSILLY